MKLNFNCLIGLHGPAQCRGLISRSRSSESSNQSAFTLVELLVTISLLSVLTTLAVVSFSSYQERARVTQATGELGELEIAINQFSIANGGQPPPGLVDIGAAGTQDPWGNNYQYVSIVGGGAAKVDQNGVPVNNDYDLYSTGPDGATNNSLAAAASADDIIRANNGGFFGRVADYSRVP